MDETIYVVIDGGSQLAEVLHEELRYGLDGYVTLALNCGARDAYGVYTEWRPKSSTPLADMSQWAYDSGSNRWSKKR